MKDLPGFPRGFTCLPEFFQKILVAQGIHWLPETLVPPDRELSLAGKCFERGRFPRCVIPVNEIDCLGRENEKPCVDHAVAAVRLLVEAGDHRVFDFQCAETPGGGGCGDCTQGTLLAMKGDGSRDVDVANAVTVGEAEVCFSCEIVANPFETPASLRVFTRVNKRDAPRFCVPLVYLHLIVAEVERDVRCVKEVVGKIFFYDVTTVSKANNEVVDSVRGIDFQYMPDDRLATDFDHGFGLEMGFFANSRAQATGENYSFQLISEEVLLWGDCNGFIILQVLLDTDLLIHEPVAVDSEKGPHFSFARAKSVPATHPALPAIH